MKQYLAVTLAFLSLITLASWGILGHRTVALIAERHLTPQAKAAVADLLGNESLADVSTWADEVRNQQEYKQTASWHFINVPLGLSYSEFADQVEHQPQDNTYKAINEQMSILEKSSSTKAQRTVALKFLVHLVGDIFQPMHVSRKEDKGGNTVQLQFDGKGTNLHSLWDSKLLDKQGNTDLELAAKLDSKGNVKTAGPMDWAYQSYKVSSKLYQEIKVGDKLDDTYYQNHIGIVNERIRSAGIVLGELLNNLFTNYKPSLSYQLANRAQSLYIKPATDAHDKSLEDVVADPENEIHLIELNKVANSIGKTVNVTGQVFGSREMGSFVLVNLGAAYPNQQLTVVLRGETKKLATDIDGKTISVTGKVTEYKGKPQIEVRELKSIIIK